MSVRQYQRRKTKARRRRQEREFRLYGGALLFSRGAREMFDQRAVAAQLIMTSQA